MKRVLRVILLLAVCAAAFCGCSLNDKPLSLENSMEIPEDGIIPASVFEHLQEENKVITFYGQSGETSYEWIVFGSDVETAQDTNLKLDVLEDSESLLSFQLHTEEAFGFSPVLSLHSAHLWNADSAAVYQLSGDTETTLCSASVTGSKTSVLNFSLSQPGVFNVLAEAAPQTEETALLYADRKRLNAGTSNTLSKSDAYFSESNGGGGSVLSDGRQTGQDQYLTNPVPEGKPLLVEPENQQVDEKKSYTCTFSIECSTILNNLDNLNTDKLDVVPGNGVIFAKSTVTFYEGESVYDVLQRVCQENGIHMEASWTPIYNSAYVEGIHNLYEFDCGTGSGWMYRVNGWYPNYGCSRYQLNRGDNAEWRYTCDLGADIGGGYAWADEREYVCRIKMFSAVIIR